MAHWTSEYSSNMNSIIRAFRHQCNFIINGYTHRLYSRYALHRDQSIQHCNFDEILRYGIAYPVLLKLGSTIITLL
jgi:hypothetical protein